MAQYVSIPKDFDAIKKKFAFGLTKRQVICFSSGFMLGVPMFFLTKNLLGITLAVTLMGIVAAPAIICGLYYKNGLYLEQVIKNMIRFYRSPQIRIYKSENFYTQLGKEMEYNKLKEQLIKAGVMNKNAKKESSKFKTKIKI